MNAVDKHAASQELADLLEDSDMHRIILGSYTGPYSLGVTQAVGSQAGAAFVLTVPNARGMPDSVTIRGKKIPVIVKGGFRAPEPL